MKKLFLVAILCLISIPILAQNTTTTFSPGPPGGRTPAGVPGSAPPILPTQPVVTSTTASSAAVPPSVNQGPASLGFMQQKNLILQCISDANTQSALNACLGR
jgi:hypothetical protein